MGPAGTRSGTVNLSLDSFVPATSRVGVDAGE